ncbi:Glycosyltransferase, catalytic subunit of cellulose synthase and poly-beta-1,6-N-acetylglucosamine synthase [Algoriphagus alkaliphilus]|uniref:Glycosyltransferase, catalytic subunit of cellulose synthase and poly-beta-1,6-N-acetylglucosamine synthase n=1 Tax=Algoriphagus alkaliphilus TaxID=279824 RepID=A0A1G5WSK8_9BACT|nr:glycosyltransferase [Algoriphagus alkaliphilus]MBA4301031.1 glycosyltransferase [Cyclobacterium sp.]SDA61012.1 Glycosyltransferase, catalytic subunit of cellulose synthase and poly-beta-1,6-N-acetylglucosamine synthase [Algoriphagus alkaliphilus]
MGLFLLWFFFGIGVIIQLVYLLVIFGRTAWFKSITKSSKNQIPEEGVTVLVAAHNEFQNLKILIPRLFEQDYPKFDVMVVNDRSTDRTKRLLEEMMALYPKLRSVTIKYTPNHVTPKKFALTLGIKVAKNDVILLTDADCMPTNDQWIRKMTAPIREDGKTFSIGFSGYEVKSSLLNKWIQFETMLTALFYFSFGLWKAPFMGVGRNLCYRKSFFMEVKAFKGLWHLEGGDDDLFVNQYATGKNSAIVIDPCATTTSIPKETWKEYLVQKKRHLNAGKYYRGEDKRKIGLFSLSHALFWIGAIGLMIYFGVETELEQFLIVLGIVLVRSFLVLSIFNSASKKIQGSATPMNVLINDFIYLGYFWVLGSVSYQAKDIPWK